MLKWLWNWFAGGIEVRSPAISETSAAEPPARSPGTSFPALVAGRASPRFESASAFLPTAMPDPLPTPTQPAWLTKLPQTVVFLDVETTGIHSDDRIVSLAAIRIESAALVHKQILTRCTHLIFDPGKKCHPEAARVHGHDEWTLSHQPFFGDHAEEIRAAIEQADLIVAHNADFDISFVNRELEAAGLPSLTKPHFCTMRTYRSRFQGRANLNTVAAHIGMARASHNHGALEDACIAMNIFLWLHDCPTRFPITQFAEKPFDNFCSVPSMPDGKLPSRKRRPRRKKATSLL